MKWLLLAATALVAGCTSTAIEDNLPKICSTATAAHSAFSIIAASGDMSPAVLRKEEAAWLVIKSVCETPPRDPATALVAAAAAYVTIAKALKEAKE